jgi:hypothetical protein
MPDHRWEDAEGHVGDERERLRREGHGRLDGGPPQTEGQKAVEVVESSGGFRLLVRMQYSGRTVRALAEYKALGTRLPHPTGTQPRFLRDARFRARGRGQRAFEHEARLLRANARLLREQRASSSGMTSSTPLDDERGSFGTLLRLQGKKCSVHSGRRALAFGHVFELQRMTCSTPLEDCSAVACDDGLVLQG